MLIFTRTPPFVKKKNTPEEIILAAIDKGFYAIGFSGHGYTEFDLRYCLKDTNGYMLEIERLKKKYAKNIQIFLGIEEDAFSPVERNNFDYIIGSSHYFFIRDQYLPIDSNYLIMIILKNVWKHLITTLSVWHIPTAVNLIISIKTVY